MRLPLSYNWRNLLARKLSTMFTFIIVMVVVLVLARLLSFATGIRASLVASSSPLNIIVLKPGATAESTSLLGFDETARLVQTPGLARLPAGVPRSTPVETGMSQRADLPGTLPAGDVLLSPELCVQTMLRHRNDGSPANVAVRGVDDVAFAVHPEVHLVAGRSFRQGVLEVIVGRAAQQRFADLDLGREMPLGRRTDRRYKVVGAFEAHGGALESEVWAPRTILQDSYHRRIVSSVCLRLDPGALGDPAAAAIAYIRSPAVGLEAKRETEYYDELASRTREIVVLTTILISIMAIGAVFAVANAMYSAVDGRRRELAMLRALGFSRAAIMLALLIEGALLCMAACACGLALSTLFTGSPQDFLSDTTWTVLAYESHVTWQIVVTALVLATLVGVIGTLAPALRAARINVLEALRKA